jgi:Zn-dependent protease with chaperone function
MEFWGRECVGKLVGGRDGMMLNADPATAHLFIANPLTGSFLGSTPPPLEDRIARLMAMKGQIG